MIADRPRDACVWSRQWYLVANGAAKQTQECLPMIVAMYETCREMHRRRVVRPVLPLRHITAKLE